MTKILAKSYGRSNIILGPDCSVDRFNLKIGVKRRTGEILDSPQNLVHKKARSERFSGMLLTSWSHSVQAIDSELRR
jgi:hypothetical protein